MQLNSTVLMGLFIKKTALRICFKNKDLYNTKCTYSQGALLNYHYFENFYKERLSAGLVCWKERTDLISKELKNCSLSPKSQMIQSRIVQGNDFSKPQMSTMTYSIESLEEKEPIYSKCFL